jgi:serine/threonine-protein kinase
MSAENQLVTRVEHSTGATSQTRPTRLPEDLLRDSARRLRIVALIYAAGFLVAELAYAVLDPIAGEAITHFYGWGPPAISIAVAVIVAALTGVRRIPPDSLMNIGLAFEVVAAYGIAFSAYWGIYQGLAHEPAHLTIFGLSFVAPWIMFFTIVCPNEPRRALLAAIAAGSSVPAVLLLTVRYGGTSIALTAEFVVSALLVPYLLIVITAYVGARVVYKLGTAVTRAREMGSYRLAEQLGRGGMGEVWKAEHRMLVRPAAIKLIRPDMMGKDLESQRTLRLRFEREAQATALMHSPHTIDVYDFGVTIDGTFYYVMELLDGWNLQELVRRFGPVPPPRTIHLLRQVCDSLAEAHERGLIHRDIKPANIYVCSQGRRADLVKVLDFGLVKRRYEPASSEPQLTAEHVVGGTPAFIAPEQITGAAVDARTDLYAVGCVAYWLLTGHLVFDAGTSVEMLADHLNTTPVPPSHASELQIPEALEAAILSCLEKDPANRPQSAEALDTLLAAVEPPSPWTPAQATEWWRLHRPTPDAAGPKGPRVQVA